MWLHMKGHMLGMAGLAGPGPGSGRFIPPPLAWGRTGRPRGKPGRRPGNGWPGSRRPGLRPSMLPSSFISVSLWCHWSKSKVQIASVIEGRASVCRLVPGVGPWLQTWLANSANWRDSRSRAGPGRRGLTVGLTCKQQLTAGTVRPQCTQITNTVMCRQDQSLGFSCSVLEISLCISHRWPGPGHEWCEVFASTKSLSGEYPRVWKVAELQFCNKWCLVAWVATLTMVLSRRAGWEQLKCAGQQNIRPCVAHKSLCLARLPGSGPVCRNCTQSGARAVAWPGPGSNPTPRAPHTAHSPASLSELKLSDRTVTAAYYWQR